MPLLFLYNADQMQLALLNSGSVLGLHWRWTNTVHRLALSA